VVSPSIRGEVPLDVIRELRKKNTKIGLDVQGFIRVAAPDGRLQHREWPEKRAVLSQTDILKADAVEARFITRETDIKAAAMALAELGPAEIVLTHRDGLLVFAEGSFHETAFHPEKIVGRSGRGDTCLGSYMARRLVSLPAEATLWAAAVTSLKMETDGPFSGQVADVANLLRRKYLQEQFA
jgi:sugar/nucleoside kinase (ribokinase family)